MASVLGGIAKGLAKLLSKVEFWLALIILAVIVFFGLLISNIALVGIEHPEAFPVVAGIGVWIIQILFLFALVAFLLYFACKLIK
ncbi:MAG: hypothetical protein EAX81_03910 [Candidatus Thorarchaeota archaeon]|nr:hypothetical protein [Candidatus Thorarchaeota archaeon]